MAAKTKLELTWIGKDSRPRLEPRILIEEPEFSYHARARRESDRFDNLLIHGDNLLALKALDADTKFCGKVKCIYIDPPFNTGAAFEHYDDGLEHSVWLGLMRERFEILKSLLAEDGAIFVQLDDRETHYCKVLLDEVFGRSNYMNTIVVSTNKPFGFKGTSSGIFKQANHILFYAKDRQKLQLNERALYIEKGYDAQYKWVFDDTSVPESEWTWSPIGEAVAAELGYDSSKAAKKALGDSFEAEVALYAIRNADRVFRTASVSGGALAKRKATIAKSRTQPKSIVRHPNDDMDYQFINGERVLWYRERLQKINGEMLPAELITDIWTDISVEGLAAEGGVDFPKGKKPEKLIGRVIDLVTEPGDIVLDSFAGSGTTGAVAHKMGRRWILVELGDHAKTHVVPRLKKVIDGSDKSGVSEAAGWKGGGGYRFCRLAPSLLEKDAWGNWVIRKEYNPAMLAEAMCKHFNYAYAPSTEHYWMHGSSSETSFIYVTTSSLTFEQLRAISDEVGENRSLLICCTAYEAKGESLPNLTLRKIPGAVLDRCEWGKDDYSLKISALPMMADEEEDEAPAAKKAKVGADGDLFDDGE